MQILPSPENAETFNQKASNRVFQHRTLSTPIPFIISRAGPICYPPEIAICG